MTITGEEQQMAQWTVNTHLKQGATDLHYR